MTDPSHLTDEERALMEAANDRSSTTPPYWTAVPREPLRRAIDTITRLREEVERLTASAERVEGYEHLQAQDIDNLTARADRAEAERDALREAMAALDAWASRMPDAGFTDKDPRWTWWYERPRVESLLSSSLASGGPTCAAR